MFPFTIVRFSSELCNLYVRRTLRSEQIQTKGKRKPCVSEGGPATAQNQTFVVPPRESLFLYLSLTQTHKHTRQPNEMYIQAENGAFTLLHYISTFLYPCLFLIMINREHWSNVIRLLIRIVWYYDYEYTHFFLS